jgi:hypothetical protein
MPAALVDAGGLGFRDPLKLAAEGTFRRNSVVGDWIEPICALATQGAAFEPEEIEVMDQAFATVALVLGFPLMMTNALKRSLGRSSSLRRRANAMS